MAPNVRSDTGKSILQYAMASEYCVLEFQEQEDGSMNVVEITEHVKRLEEQNNARPE